jgi:hypothetical protein
MAESLSVRRAPRTSLAPVFANRRLAASPIPLLAPVTAITFSDMSFRTLLDVSVANTALIARTNHAMEAAPSFLLSAGGPFDSNIRKMVRPTGMRMLTSNR